MPFFLSNGVLTHTQYTEGVVHFTPFKGCAKTSNINIQSIWSRCVKSPAPLLPLFKLASLRGTRHVTHAKTWIWQSFKCHQGPTFSPKYNQIKKFIFDPQLIRPPLNPPTHLLHTDSRTVALPVRKATPNYHNTPGS